MSIAIWIIIVIVAVGAVIALLGWDRYRGSHKGASAGSGATPTDEVFVDPETGKRMRVWYDPKTGQREYHSE